MQQLIVKFGPDTYSPVPWLLFDKNEQEIIASGELTELNQLDQLKDKADQSEVICLIPACDVMATHVDLPEKFNRKLLNAVHYMIEDKLAFDVDTQFIAKGSIEGQKLPVIVIDRDRLQFYKDAIDSADIFCQKIFVDGSLLPQPAEGETSLVQIGGELLAKQSKFEAISGEVAWLGPLLAGQVESEATKLKAFSEIETEIDNESAENVKFNYDKLPLELLLSNIDDTSINVLQGEFAVKNNANPTWDKWRVAAILAGIALATNIGLKTVELNSIKQQRAALDEEIVSIVQAGFPEIQRIRKATLKRTISQEIAKLEAGGGNASMLVMLTQMSPAFQKTGVTPQSLNFNSDRSELRIQSVAQNFESLERFTREISDMGLTVEQGAINNRGDQVVGIVVVKG